MFLSRLLDYTRIRAHMANGITLMNLSFGVMAIMFINRGHGRIGLLFIVLAALFDRFDGKVARKLNTASDFGKELDSLCDLVSFGIAPALLIYQTVLYQIPVGGIFITVLFILCGAIRLARFNVKECEHGFEGVPITAAGVLLVFTFFLIPYVPIGFFAVFEAILLVLMVSRIRIAKI